MLVNVLKSRFDLLLICACVAISAIVCKATDWPQHQRDAARTGRTTDTVPPPFRSRWVWLGPNQTLRNSATTSDWPDDLRSRDGYAFPNLPSRVDFTFAESAQPILTDGRIYIGSMDGTAFAISADDGSTVWKSELPGGTCSTAAAADGVVIFSTLNGSVLALKATNGAPVWKFDCGKAITSAPCVVSNVVIVATHGGRVFAFDVVTGAKKWQSEKLNRPIYGGLASDGASVFVGTEDMTFYAMNLSDGAIKASKKLRGQSFRMLWPVVISNQVWASTVTIPIIGSEYIGETNSGSSLLRDGTNLVHESQNILRWLNGDTDSGHWPEASPDWKHLFVLDRSTLAESFTVPAPPVDGVGVPAHPPVLDNSGRVLTYFKTKFPTITKPNGGVFGTRFTIDVSAVNPVTGDRVPIDNGRLSNIWPWETDNLYGMAVAGNQLWLRQNFRGTMVIDLSTSSYRGVSAPIRHHDGGNFNWDVVYKDQGPPIRTSQAPLLGRTGPIIVGDRVYQAEIFGITCIEHALSPALSLRERGNAARPPAIAAPTESSSADKPVAQPLIPALSQRERENVAPPPVIGRSGVETPKYAWQFPQVSSITNADDLVRELHEEVQRVLDAGPMAPLYISFSDQESVGYTVYQEPGRIVTTLAWAFPYLTPAQQVRAKAYVNAELSNPTNAPWGVTAYGKNGNSNYPLPHFAGAPRELHPKSKWWFERKDFGKERPFLHTLYGVWLYGYRTHDWSAASNDWTAIKQSYAAYGNSDAHKLYGTLSLHIAMIRLAVKFGDGAQRDSALANLQARLNEGLNFDAVETITRGKKGSESKSPYGSYPNMYDARMNSSTYHGWMFLNLCPEIGRYLCDADPSLRSAVLARHEAGKSRFPLWWMPKASYFNRSWTGDEGSGLVPEMVGMIAPVQRWVVKADAATLRRQMRSAPNGIGDCYWLEALVQAIEAHGKLVWKDVRD